MLNYDLLIHYPFCHPKMANVDVPRPLRSGAPALHQRHTIEIVLIHDHGSNGVALPDHKIPEVNGLRHGVREAHILRFGAGLSHDLLL